LESRGPHPVNKHEKPIPMGKTRNHKGNYAVKKKILVFTKSYHVLKEK